MKIYLARHGVALPAEIDPEKGLSPDGRTKVEQVARHLAEKSFPLSMIYHSEKTRAQQTAAIFKDYIAPEASLILLHHMNPNDPIDEVLEHIDNDCLFVGHLPFMANLCAYLGVRDITFSEATCVCLERQNGKWKLLWAISPETLSE